MGVTPTPTQSDPRELRVIQALVKEGFEPAEVCRRLDISRATYYRRMKEIRLIRENAMRERGRE